MTMIGPAAANQLCPTCQGEGATKVGSHQEWRGSASLGEYVTVGEWAICDTCAGEGAITRKHLREIKQQAN